MFVKDKRRIIYKIILTAKNTSSLYLQNWSIQTDWFVYFEGELSSLIFVLADINNEALSDRPSERLL